MPRSDANSFSSYIPRVRTPTPTPSLPPPSPARQGQQLRPQSWCPHLKRSGIRQMSLILNSKKKFQSSFEQASRNDGSGGIVCGEFWPVFPVIRIRTYISFPPSPHGKKCPDVSWSPIPTLSSIQPPLRFGHAIQKNKSCSIAPLSSLLPLPLSAWNGESSVREEEKDENFPPPNPSYSPPPSPTAAGEGKEKGKDFSQTFVTGKDFCSPPHLGGWDRARVCTFPGANFTKIHFYIFTFLHFYVSG